MRQALVVDDDITIGKLLHSFLERQGYTALLAMGGSEALEFAASQKPNLIILDLDLPDLSGLEVCSRLRAWYEGPIVIISGDHQERTIVEALDSGADDYLTKPFRLTELAARLRATERRVSRAESPQDESIQAGELQIDLARRLVRRGEIDIHLTRSQFEILWFLARNRDRALPLEAILNHFWGPHHGDYIQALRVHIRNIRQKIEPNPGEPQYLLTRPGVGYQFCEPEAIATIL